ncbi:hypothetical protein [Parachryseolinea silvisoli]|jgi:hypothetical protein|uniref:hypothetical protein n=1 Tax=Parachryseolinea silvisoli TaxID=2873601 RepID=UPI002265A941|nr:hypothetical protein [Parachryseolinea silvisoli]MCD9017110.1 hypothetical protein [Parachryseolinea silvisoli]
MTESLLVKLIFWAGIGHFILCLSSLFVPKALQWREHLKNLQPLLRQMFWTYAGYILVINFCFGIVSVGGGNELVGHSFLAKSMTLFIALYWLTRIGIQFLYFDRSQAPKGFIYTLGEIGLVSMFASFTVIYFLAFLHTLA